LGFLFLGFPGIGGLTHLLLGKGKLWGKNSTFRKVFPRNWPRKKGFFIEFTLKFFKKGLELHWGPTLGTQALLVHLGKFPQEPLGTQDHQNLFERFGPSGLLNTGGFWD